LLEKSGESNQFRRNIKIDHGRMWMRPKAQPKKTLSFPHLKIPVCTCINLCSEPRARSYIPSQSDTAPAPPDHSGGRCSACSLGAGHPLYQPRRLSKPLGVGGSGRHWGRSLAAPTAPAPGGFSGPHPRPTLAKRHRSDLRARRGFLRLRASESRLHADLSSHRGSRFRHQRIHCAESASETAVIGFRWSASGVQLKEEA